MADVTLHLTKQQLKKIQEGKPVQLSHKHLMGQHNGSGFPTKVSMDPKTYKKLHKRMLQGKGIRLPAGLLSRAVSTAQNIVKALPTRTKRSLAKVVDGVVHGDVKKIAEAGKEIGKDVLQGVQAVNKFTGGEIVDVPKIHPQKGSDEMRERMAHLRSLRKKPVAGSNLLNNPDNVEVGGDLISFKKEMRARWGKSRTVPEAHKRLLQPLADAVAQHSQQGGSFKAIKGKGFKPIGGSQI